MHKLTILTLVAFFLTATCLSTIQPAKGSVEEVATSASITIQPETVIPGKPFTVAVQIHPSPPTNSDVFYNIHVTVTSAAQGINGYGPWSDGPSSSDTNGVASFTFPGSVSSIIGEAGGGNIEVGFPGQFFGSTTVIHYQVGDWQKNFFVSSPQTPTPQPTSTIPKPSIPEFTARFTDSSFEVTIKNQPEPLMALASNTSLYYGFRFKNPNSTLVGDWNYAPIFYVGTSSYGTYYKASASNYTVTSFPLDDYPFDGENHRTGISKSGPIDMQVMALIGNEVPTDYENGSVYAFYGATSDWSNTQTVTLQTSSDSPFPSATVPSPTHHSGLVPQNPLIIIAISMLVSIVLLAVIVIVVRHRKNVGLKQ